VKELHVELVVFHDQDGLRHSFSVLLRPTIVGIVGKLVPISYGWLN